MAVVLLVVAGGCRRPEPARPIEYVGGTDRHPGIPSEPASASDSRERTSDGPREAPTGPPLAFEDGVPIFTVDHWYWCFATKNDGPDLCGATHEICSQWMEKMGSGTGCVAAPQGVCFHTSHDGKKPDFGLCFRTPSDRDFGLRGNGVSIIA